MQQLTFFEKAPTIVNVASIPHRSPFRYPGGKTWLVPRVREWLGSLPARPAEFVEPFAGGGIVSLTVAFEGLADHVTMVELDDQVASVWSTIFGADREWLAERILSFEFTPAGVRDIIASEPATVREKAFRTVLKNRVNRGGILAAGAGLQKHGENGRELGSRWHPETLARRILMIGTVAEKITFIEGDGMKVLRGWANTADLAAFIDPPYTAGAVGSGKRAGTRLYTHSRLDHEELFEVAADISGDFVMTYDDADEVRALAVRHGLETRLTPMKNTHHAAMMELLVGRDLSWVWPTDDHAR